MAQSNRLDCSGAEAGDNELDSILTTPVLGVFHSSNLTARSGARSWRASLIGATALLDTARGTMAFTASSTEWTTVAFSIYVGAGRGIAAGTSDITVLRLPVAAGGAELRILHNGATWTPRIVLTDGVQSTALNYAPQPLDQWVRCVVWFRINPGVGLSDIFYFSTTLRGSDLISVSRDIGLTNPASLDFGVIGQNDLLSLATDLNIFFDDIIISDYSEIGAPDQLASVGFGSFLTYMPAQFNLQNAHDLTGINGICHGHRNSDDNAYQDEENLGTRTARFSLPDIDGGVVFPDASGNQNHGLAHGGTVTTSIKGASWGTGFELDGVDREDNSDHIRIPDIEMPGPAEERFCVEFWVRVDATMAGHTQAWPFSWFYIPSWGADNTTAVFDGIGVFRLASGNWGFNWYVNGVARMTSGQADTGVPCVLGQTYHIAYVGDTNVKRLYIDGVLAFQDVADGTNFKDGTRGDMVLGYIDMLNPGAHTSYPLGMRGAFDDFRFVRGDPVYTANFTPPTAPLTAIPGTEILLSMDSTRTASEIPASALEVVSLYASARSLNNDAAPLGGTLDVVLTDGVDSTAGGSATNAGVPATHRSLEVAMTDWNGAAWSLANANAAQIQIATTNANAAQACRYSRLWGYAEMKVNVLVDDGLSLVEDAPTITAELDIEDGITLSEELDIFVTMALSDSMLLVENDPDIFATVGIEDAINLVESAEQITFIREDLCSGSGGSIIFVFDD